MRPVSRCPVPRGYTAPVHTRWVIAAAHSTKLWLSTAQAVADQTVIVTVLIFGACPALWTGWHAVVGLAVAGIGAVLLGRQYRALECMAHEASHYNWTRDKRHLNDLQALNLLWPATISKS